MEREISMHDYHHSDSIEGLSKSIDRAIVHGWEPFGPLVVSVVRDKEYFYQAVVTYDKK